ncbi:Uncharacterized protein Fot_11792 [Forsythia ovata]|uniref:Ubiquitin fusion degradation protein UFD1 N-terminal subdomain 2 domain-containing protein n=1 Tax=Forsythia ovata TaxID=205694 RepID=A0ABD1WL40_9LAMI
MEVSEPKIFNVVCLDFAKSYIELKQLVLAELANYHISSEESEEQIADRLYKFAHMIRMKCKEFSLVVTMKLFFDYLVDPSDIQNNGPHMVPASMEAIMLLSRKRMEYETDDAKVESCMICLEEIVKGSMGRSSSLLTGDTTMINHSDEKFFINVLETKPGPAICLIGTDCEADFSPPLDYKEPEKRAKVEQNAPVEVQKKEIGERPAFRPFMGKGRCLDGEPVEIVKDDYLPTTTTTGGCAGGSTTLGSRKKRGTIVFGSNGVETKTRRDDPEMKSLLTHVH